MSLVDGLRRIHIQREVARDGDAAFLCFGKEGKIVVLGLNLDGKSDAVKAFIENNKMTWPQGLLGEWSNTRVPEEWCLRGLP